MDNNRVMNVNYCIMLSRNGRGRITGPEERGGGKKGKRKNQAKINVRKIAVSRERAPATAFPFKYCN